MKKIEKIKVNDKLIRRLNSSWGERATVCSIDKFQINVQFEPDKPDYPLSMIPFLEHSDFKYLKAEIQNQVITWGWIGYNKRTIAAEDFIVNPAFSLISDSPLLGKDSWIYKEALRQALIDEHFHTLMHLKAIERTKKQRNIDYELDLPMSVTYRKLKELHSTLDQKWHREFASIAFAIVAEISVNAFLEILAEDKNIQKQNSLVAKLHNRDEYAHGKVLAEIGKVMYMNMNDEEKEFFIGILPESLSAFLAQDFLMWEAILTKLKIPNAKLIIKDVKKNSSVLSRDYSGLYKFVKGIGALNEINFSFSEKDKKSSTLNTTLEMQEV